MSKLDALFEEINKSAKETIVSRGLNEFSYKRIPFTSPRMNYCTFGGLPIGKIIEFYGEEHGGKTTSALDIVANYQNMKDTREVLYVDAENTLDIDWARKIGVDVDKLWVLQPKSQSAEDIFQIICDAIETGEIGLWVLDSIGALVGAQELDDKKTFEDKVYGGISQPLTRFSKTVEMLMHKHKCTGIGINQLRDDIGSTWGGTKTPGGRAWKHHCAVRLQFSRGKFLDLEGKELTRSAETPVGNKVLMSMTKNKTCPPTRRTGYYTINYEIGIDYLKDLVEVAIQYDIIDKRGAWFSIIDIDTGEVIVDKLQGQYKVYELLDNDMSILERIESLVDSRLFDNRE